MNMITRKNVLIYFGMTIVNFNVIFGQNNETIVTSEATVSTTHLFEPGFPSTVGKKIKIYMPSFT